MSADRRRRIEDLVVRMQQAFLDAPALRLTIPQARREFSAGAAMCGAVLDVLEEAGVLCRTSEGEYVRLTPRTSGRAAALPRKREARTRRRQEPIRLAKQW